MNKPFTPFYQINCSHFGICSGCSTNTPFADETSLYNRARKFLFEVSDGMVDLKFIHGEPVQWRTRAKLACQKDRNGVIHFGLYRKGSHDVTAIPKCRVHHPSINEAVDVLAHILNRIACDKKDVAYDESTHTGILRYIQCSVERRSNKVQLALVVNQEDGEEKGSFSLIKEAIIGLLERKKDLFSSLWINYNPRRTNTIFGSNWQHVYGELYIWENIAGREIPILPHHFEQANLEVFEKALIDISRHLELDDHLIELYAGMGVISLALRDKVSSTEAIEANPESYHSFLEAKKRLPLSLQENCLFEVGESEKLYIHRKEKKRHVLLLDPPRKGLGASFTEFLAQRNEEGIKKLIYISCHYPSFERDILHITRLGRWNLAHSACYLFFPGTNHIETVAILQ